MNQNSFNLELCQIDIELFGGSVDSSQLVYRLDSLCGKSKLDAAVQVLGEELLGLKVDMLDLLDTLVREGNNAGTSVGCLSEQVADTGSHFHGSGARARGKALSLSDNRSAHEGSSLSDGNDGDKE